MHASLNRPVFLFDADCGVCQNATDAIRARVRPPVDIVGYQTVDFAALGVSEQELSEGPVFVDVDGSRSIGPLGMARMLTMSGAGYRMAGRFILAPGVRNILGRLGPVMYRYKDRLPGATPACSV